MGLMRSHALNMASVSRSKYLTSQDISTTNHLRTKMVDDHSDEASAGQFACKLVVSLHVRDGFARPNSRIQSARGMPFQVR